MGNRILKLSFGVTFVLVMSCDELASVFGDQIEGDWEISSAVIYENFDLSMKITTENECFWPCFGGKLSMKLAKKVRKLHR